MKDLKLKNGSTFLVIYWAIVLFLFPFVLYSEKKTTLYEFIENEGKAKQKTQNSNKQNMKNRAQASSKNNSPLENGKKTDGTDKSGDPEGTEATVPEKNTGEEKKVDVPVGTGSEIETTESKMTEEPKYTLATKGSGKEGEGYGLSNLDGNAGRRIAVIVGVNRYEDANIANLEKARNDAIRIRDILKTYGDFEVYLMTDAIDHTDLHYPTKNKIETKLNGIIKSLKKEDFFLFFFSGHGVSDNFENGYLLPTDARESDQISSGVKIQDIVDKLKEYKVKKSLLMLDACRLVKSKTKSTVSNRLKNQEFAASEVGATVFSTKAGKPSFEGKNNGIFTEFLIRGMEGEADKGKYGNRDGVVTFSEIKRYLEDQMRQWSIKNYPNEQLPFTKIYGEQFGDLALTAAAGDPEHSLADIPLPKIYTEYEIALRSALVPGWGQHVNQRKKLGMSVGYPYFAIGLLGLGYYYSNYHQLQNLRAAYSSVPLIPYSRNVGETSAFNFFMKQSAESSYNSQFKKTNIILGALVGFWAWNVFDSYYFFKYKKIDEISVGMDYGTRKQNFQLESYGGFQLTYRF
ncbi:MAG: caspase family protein [Leptospiraceae bacterium]|nr:caspase family protein [Leptospiraceae bacterium]MCP5500501.1 caspase family protein [Leptospiraceae bacterium]